MSTNLAAFDNVRDMAVDVMTKSPSLVNKVDGDIRDAIFNFTSAPAEWYEDRIAVLRDNESHQRANVLEAILRYRMAIALLELFKERLYAETELLEEMFDALAPKEGKKNV